jgi:hypothetical protein
MSGRSEARIYEICLFFINLVILIKKLFNVTKFELKKYDFILNNVIKTYFIIFLLMGRGMPD